MKRKITIILLLLTINLTNSQEIKHVSASELNVREGAGKNFNVTTKVTENEKVTIISEQGKWSEIETENGQKGFVSTKFLSNSVTETNSKSGKSDSILHIIVIGFLLFLTYKGRNIIYAIFGPSNGNSRSTQSSYKPKIKANHWYHCKNCNIKIEGSKQPTSQNCSNSTFHLWTDLGEVGNQAYSCKNCATTVYVTKQPTSQRCPRETFHRWTKLS
ncbi:SH3 domain-containing protein [Flavobacterium psychrophilum]|nr:SH3 domain-containing protein [Flavobacterium psychrophilum]EKT4518348.1 SH3 domain-containing protein [Flavobacterium psychrophilum]